MEGRGRCRRCHTTFQFCPCCGAALLAAGEISAKGNHRSLTPVASASAQEDDGGSMNDTWMQRLPDRPVSAYDAYQAEQLDALCRGDATTRPATENAGQQNISQAECASSQKQLALRTCNAFDSFAEDPQEQQKHQRAVAVAWLQLPLQEKQHYEAVAQRWACYLRSKACSEQQSPAPPLTEILAAKRSAVPVTKSEANAPVEAAATTDMETASKTIQDIHHATRKAPPKRSSGTALISSKATNRGLTSFNLFRAEIKGRGWKVSEAAAVWQRMSATEKGRYDVAAARNRTEGFLTSSLQSS
ncbi:hypothetical protein ABL78_6340 [Leptomonas seymouri]|uniref:Uncharacterized protein n=1 Tax=Leptomonas seymouri TaxID=5684 RepID=A0A0N1PAX4_LEPSE|nr:hypothetical protein ABL78_6340 [Leptomonas seymouri]|eukprot:KPI84608.1 hypothetical protein ABL78_6340 [Leptomonas seymouri]